MLIKVSIGVTFVWILEPIKASSSKALTFWEAYYKAIVVRDFPVFNFP